MNETVYSLAINLLCVIGAYSLGKYLGNLIWRDK